MVLFELVPNKIWADDRKEFENFLPSIDNHVQIAWGHEQRVAGNHGDILTVDPQVALSLEAVEYLFIRLVLVFIACKARFHRRGADPAMC